MVSATRQQPRVAPSLLWRLGCTGRRAVPVPVYVGFAANSAAAQTAITANYPYAPAVAALTGPAPAVPQFVASTFTAANGSIISNCQTTLLFPFVTNQLGFDTGFAIANTSVDNLALGGKSLAAAQSGTCQLFFYGPTAPATDKLLTRRVRWRLVTFTRSSFRPSLPATRDT